MPDYEHSQVAHFRHCVRIESVAEAYRTLHATVYPSSYNNLAIIESLTFDEASSAGHQYDGTLFWIYPGRPEDPEGCCYIASTISIANQTNSRQLCHNIFRASSSQAQCYMRADNDWSTSEQWYIVARGDGEFSIHAAGDDACLTANLSGGIASFSTYDGSANQRWRLMTQYSPMGGVFHVAPSLDDSQAMQCLTDSNMAFASIGSSSQKGTHSALVSEFVNQLESPTSLVGSFATDISYPINRAETKWNRSNIFDSTSKRIQFATGDRKLSSSLGTRNGAWMPEGDGGGLITTTGLGGTFKAQKWLYPVSGTPLALSSYDGENRLGGFPTGQTSTSDPMDQTQHWWMLPANLYDDALPVPYDVRIRIRDSGNTFYDLTSTQSLPIDDDITCSLYPAFRCDHGQFRIIFRLKYLVDGVWEGWDRVLEPSNGNISSTSAAPYALLGGGPGWIPNAWSWDTSQGYDTTAPAEVTGGIFDGHDDATACLISMSVTPMRYGAFTGQPPLPYEGRTITTDAIVSRHVTASLSSAAVTRNGIEFGLAVDGVSGASDFTTHVTSISVSHSGDFTSHEYLDHAVDCEMGGQTVGRYDATIPFTELCAMDTFLLSSSVDTSHVVISGSVRTQFGDTGFSVSHAFGSGFTSLRYPSTQTISNPWLGEVEDLYSPQGDFYARFGFLTLASERGTRIVPVSRMTGANSVPVLNRAGSYVGSDSDVTSQIGVAIIQSGSSWGYCVVSGVQHPYHQIPCIFRRRDEGESTDRMEVIPLQGNVSTSFSAKNDVTVRRRLGGRRSVVGTLGGQQSELQFTGAIFRDQLSEVEGLPSSMGSTRVIMRQDIQVLYEISPDETLILRTAHGTAYAVRLVSIDSPRDKADLANVTLSFVEVES